MGPSCVFNYKNVIELWVMETENNQNVFSVSITHNSKIRELSDENKVMKTRLSFAKQPFCYGSHHFWVMSYENRELSYGNMQSKQPLNLLLLCKFTIQDLFNGAHMWSPIEIKVVFFKVVVTCVLGLKQC